jgi:hypothetical protein
VRELIRFGGEVKDISERLTTSAESVQTLMEAAQLGGGDIGDVATAFDRLVKAMEAARGGDKGMAQTLEALGATAQDLATMNVDKVFRAIADSIEDLAGNSESSALMMEVFGRSGTKLIPIMKELAQLRSEPFIKQENINLLDEMGDAMTRLGHKTKVLLGTGLARFFKFWLPTLAHLSPKPLRLKRRRNWSRPKLLWL